MANPGIGYRSVYEMLYEISHHLIAQTAFTTLSSAVTPGLQFVGLGSTNNLIQGTQIVVDPGLPTEEAIYLGTVTATQIQALFANSHSAGAIILASCFPEQAATDPFYTQSEIIGYISRAQNEFLSRVPCSFLLLFSEINFGQLLQSLPCTPIELIRVALSPTNIPIVSLTRAGGIVTAVTAVAHNLNAKGKFSIINSPLGVGSTQFN